ncbi:MAG: glycosyltransferase family 39 protein [Candidatus Peribacteraceae bacterium]|nr:glycosyltransferase family 39 protein [Candidatus Peribacteraceae bacterium]
MNASAILPLLPPLLLSSATTMAGVILLQRFVTHKEVRLQAAIFLGGSMLRILYTFSTPATLRSYDLRGHLQFIQLMAEHLQIPLSTTGWEYSQAPLYYAITGLWWRMMSVLGRPPSLILLDLQTFSLLLSIAVLLLCIWIGYSLFIRSNERIARLLFTATCAVFPGLVFVASRISNDALLNFFLFLSFALMLRWWRSGKTADWLALCVCCATAFLSKFTAALLLPCIAILWIIRTKKTPSFSLKYGLIGLLIFALLAGWFPIVKFLEPRLRMMPFGPTGLNPRLFVGNHLSDYLIFNPFAVIAIPFNQTWIPAFRREIFWEFFFKSLFFGEFLFLRLIRLSSLILLLALSLLPVGFAGFWQSFRRHFRETLPVNLIFFALLSGLVAYRILQPYSCSQDFRFVPLLFVPMLFFTLRGISATTYWLRYGFFSLFTLDILCAIFLLLLPRFG